MLYESFGKIHEYGLIGHHHGEVGTSKNLANYSRIFSGDSGHCSGCSGISSGITRTDF